MAPDEPTPARRNALTALGVNRWFIGDLERAEYFQSQALALAREIGDPKAIIENLWFSSLVISEHRQVDKLLEVAAEADQYLDRIGTVLWRTVPPTIRTLAAQIQGDHDAARRYLIESLDYHKRNGFLWPFAWVQGLLAETEAAAGNSAESLRLYQEILEQFHSHGDVYATLDCISAIAQFAATHGDPAVAAQLCGAIATARTIVGKRVTWASIRDEQALSLAKSSLPTERFEQELELDRRLSVAEALELAMSVKPIARQRVEQAPETEDRFGLSPREIEVLRLLVMGQSNEQIGAALFISPRTAGTHVANILGKLGVHSRAAAVGLALSQKLV
jgi:non-specific serine/threonine protein kinase